MEDPEREVTLMWKKLFRRPTFEGMGDTLRQYFTEDVAYYHELIYVGPKAGIRKYTLFFQFMLFFMNYQDVLIHDVVYDKKENLMAIRMTVRANPWIFLWRTNNMKFLTELEFRDVKDENTGKVLKKIKVQRDYYIRAPGVQLIPIIGEIYDSDQLRYFLVEVTASIHRFLISAYHLLVPAILREAVFKFWRAFLQVPLTEHVVPIHKIVD
ncbi:hypothetical protein R1sor_008477 [Riccia sorocarpa]|uniref:SigF-like NTF2-like domain-containing protein n=1 Tax=Riccia sorocarpa TaxID=122646 RepID=A0ABD3HXN5_9MARC